MEGKQRQDQKTNHGDGRDDQGRISDGSNISIPVFRHQTPGFRRQTQQREVDPSSALNPALLAMRFGNMNLHNKEGVIAPSQRVLEQNLRTFQSKPVPGGQYASTSSNHPSPFLAYESGSMQFQEKYRQHQFQDQFHHVDVARIRERNSMGTPKHIALVSTNFMNSLVPTSTIQEYERPTNTSGDGFSRFEGGMFEHALTLQGDKMDAIIVDMAMRREGALELQNLIIQKQQKPLQWMAIYNTIGLKYMNLIMINLFGQSVFQTMLKACSQRELESILLKLSTSPRLLVQLAKHNQHGSGCIQCLITIIRKDGRLVDMFLNSIDGYLENLISNHEGRCVINQCLKKFDYEKLRFIFWTASTQCTRMAVRPNAYLFLNECILYIQGPDRGHLLATIAYNSVALSIDQYGNFVVQCVIEQNDDSINAIICNCFSGFYVPMFKDKFGSRVVETLLKYCSIILLEELVSELLDNIELIELVQDQYGNYAMKALLNAIQGNNVIKQRVWGALVPLMKCTLLNSYGKYVYKLMKTLDKDNEYNLRSKWL